MTISWAYIFHAPGTDPVKDRVVIDREGLTSILVPVPDRAAAIAVAQSLVAEGVRSIELCGYFGTVEAGKLITAIEGKIPVGAVTFGSESAIKLGQAFQGAPA